MPLLVEQLIYTSFPKIGFKCLVSEQVPLGIQQAFCDKIVHQHWDTYNPPDAGYRAAYMYQVSPNQTLFGWLYNDGTDDFGRANIPYFICYYLPEALNTFQLDKILTCLETGPVNLIDRHYPPDSLENLLIPDFCLYEAPRRGVSISSEIRQQTHNNLKQQIFINLYIIGERTTIIQPKHSAIQPKQTFNGQSQPQAQPQAQPQPQLQPQPQPQQVNTFETVLDLPTEPGPLISLSMDKIETVLKELTAKPIGVEGLVLVSAQGHPIIPPIGLDHNSALIMAGTMLYLAKSTQEEFNWQICENVSVRGQNGHVILATCNDDTFLLVKTGKAVTGLLEGEINRTVKKLQTIMDERQKQESNPLKSPTEPLPQPTAKAELPNQEMIYQVTTETPFDPEAEIRYRGRRTN